MRDENVYSLAAAPKFKDDDDVMATYNTSVPLPDKLEKAFEKFKLEWEEEECLESDEDGGCTEMAGTLTGTYKNVMAFLKSAFPGDKKLDVYITKI